MKPVDIKILINDSGVHTTDPKGSQYYRGIAQFRIPMVLNIFCEVQKKLSKQLINGMPLNLKELEVLTAANNIIPYNSVNEKSIMPIEAGLPMQNRAVWYNAKFNVGTRFVQTGWICNNFYINADMASKNAASDVAGSLANTAAAYSAVIYSIKAQMEQKKR